MTAPGEVLTHRLRSQIEATANRRGGRDAPGCERAPRDSPERSLAHERDRIEDVEKHRATRSDVLAQASERWSDLTIREVAAKGRNEAGDDIEVLAKPERTHVADM
jgi:hypothetical protein